MDRRMNDWEVERALLAAEYARQEHADIRLIKQAIFWTAVAVILLTWVL